MAEQWQQVLDFWFEGGEPGEAQRNRWWQKDEEVDRWIRERYSDLMGEVNQSLHNSWGVTPEGRLAAIICLDQLPRNAWRGDGRSFQFDQRAKELTDQGLELGHDRRLTPLERSFFIMPLMHDESLASQNRCIELLQELVNETEGGLQEYLSGSLQFGKRHREIIERFGRYPHRNRLLGRVSSEEEEVFLAQPGSGF